MKLKIKYSNKNGEKTHMWKLNYLQINQWAKEDITDEENMLSQIGKYKQFSKICSIQQMQF